MDSNTKTFRNTESKSALSKSDKDTFSRPTVVDLQFDTGKGDDMLAKSEIRLNKRQGEGTNPKDSPPYFK